MSVAVCSMTGYASVQVDSGGHANITLTLKSVNHRFFDLQVRLPRGFDGLEAQIRKALKAYMQRGHVEFTLQLDRVASAPSVALNEELLAAYVAAFRKAGADYGFSGEPNLNDVLRVPGMIGGQALTPPDETGAIESAVMAALKNLVTSFHAVRAEEGAALAAELRASMLRLGGLVEEASGLREGVRAASFERLRVKIVELTRGLAVAEDRLLAEAALVADKSDIEEELVRLYTHAAGFVAMLDAGGPVGKRLDFLLQELNREANTLLSKTGGASSQNGLRITELGLEMKMEIERAKEQVQNLE